MPPSCKSAPTGSSPCGRADSNTRRNSGQGRAASMFDWLAPLGVPLIRRAVVTLLVAGATFSLYGVFIITQGLTVIRFSLLHVGLLGSAVAVACGWEPLAGALVAIVLAALSLGPLSERLK